MIHPTNWQYASIKIGETQTKQKRNVTNIRITCFGNKYDSNFTGGMSIPYKNHILIPDYDCDTFLFHFNEVLKQLQWLNFEVDEFWKQQQQMLRSS